MVLGSAVSVQIAKSDLLSADDFLLLNVANFHEIKAHKLLFQVMGSHNKHPNIKLLCMGNVFNEEYFKEIQSLLSKLKLQGTVFIKDFTEDIWNYYRIADCFILLSFYEGWSLAMTEAMYYSLPLILSDQM